MAHMVAIHKDGSITINLEEKERETLAILLDRVNMLDTDLDTRAVLTLYRYMRTDS